VNAAIVFSRSAREAPRWAMTAHPSPGPEGIPGGAAEEPGLTLTNVTVALVIGHPRA
jgi:hypothetical protein